jgi:hypothetical protein
LVIKGNNKYFPQAALRAVLLARHGTRPAGHWVVMTTEIGGVFLIAICYAWSQQRCSYFISTCGSTTAHPIKYETSYEDEWGQTAVRYIDRPNIVHMTYMRLPEIDEINKQRQAILRLEKRWLTKNPFHRLVTTLLAMSVVDMHHCFRHHEVMLKRRRFEEVDSIGVRKFTDLMCGQLKPWPLKKVGPGRKRGCLEAGKEAASILVRITKPDGSTTVEPTTKQELKGRRTGNGIVWNCFVCRKYQDQDGITVRKNTMWKCRYCGMPLCNACRKGTNGRSMDCCEEHLDTNDALFACNDTYFNGKEVPKECQVNLNPKKRKRSSRL